ncbi:MAG: Rieske 2Fe-2S domain-containing protein, partial [Polaromonas sp.]|nr:Rieske 2Fe-2S domain-containing protein [Polaromonas sp.]
MSEGNPVLEGDDFTLGVEIARIAPNGMLLGHAHGEPVILARHGNELFAVGATCTHYGGPLAEGLLVGDTLRCPWHHACFSLRTGEALRAPALNPVSCWRVEQRDGKAYVSAKRISAPARSAPAAARLPESMVIIG